MKLKLLNAITFLRTEGVNKFNVVLDQGFGLYAAEMIAGLRDTDPEVELDLFVPYEELEAEWMPVLRDRYLAVYKHANVLATISKRDDVDREFLTYLSSFESAGSVDRRDRAGKPQGRARLERVHRGLLYEKGRYQTGKIREQRRDFPALFCPR